MHSEAKSKVHAPTILLFFGKDLSPKMMILVEARVEAEAWTILATETTIAYFFANFFWIANSTAFLWSKLRDCWWDYNRSMLIR